MDTIVLSVATQFSRTPGSRYAREGHYSGETFRRDLLLPNVRRALTTGSGLRVELDGTAGYGTSFLEEAFGGLVREDSISANDLKRILTIVSDEEDYLISDILTYIEEAAQSRDQAP